MINTNQNLPYFKLTNNGQCNFAFTVNYMSGGVPVSAFSKAIPPGTSKSINIAADSTNITFTVYTFNPPYQFTTIYSTSFSTAVSRCYLASGTLESPNLLRIPCYYSPCCCCCCRCCNPCCYNNSYCNTNYSNPYV
ncbi:hypothetical protein ADU90_14865 [Clostridium botulinum]|uniref:hypothetical protein n=1 Tax=Clostridium botulinum TaxID=1491 RepID=UPI0006A486A5|nr:hypothetical protein [Clostridium botulinum]KOC51403.1 hypothetical protein ADU89_13645 [Clostridium botulinum]KOC52055.1 hypothetical protein ADU90_14865 [Clostridium botulinum]